MLSGDINDVDHLISYTTTIIILFHLDLTCILIVAIICKPQLTLEKYI